MGTRGDQQKNLFVITAIVLPQLCVNSIAKPNIYNESYCVKISLAPETLRTLCPSTKFPHQDIRGNFWYTGLSYLEAYSESCQIFKMVFFKNSLRPSIVSYFCKNFHLRCLRGFLHTPLQVLVKVMTEKKPSLLHFVS